MAQRKSVEKRFWEKVDRSGGPDACWEWQGSKNWGGGYGQFGITPGRRAVGAHRVAYMLTRGEIPPGLYICHSCNNPPCCNPAHLSLGTPKKNIEYCIQSGRFARGERNGARTKPERLPRGERNGSAKLTEEQVREIRRRYSTDNAKQCRLATEYDVSASTIYDIVHHKVWAHISDDDPITDEKGA